MLCVLDLGKYKMAWANDHRIADVVVLFLALDAIFRKQMIYLPIENNKKFGNFTTTNLISAYRGF